MLIYVKERLYVMENIFKFCGKYRRHENQPPQALRSNESNLRKNLSSPRDLVGSQSEIYIENIEINTSSNAASKIAPLNSASGTIKTDRKKQIEGLGRISIQESP